MASKVLHTTTSAKRPPVDAILGAYLRTGDRPYIHICWMLHNHCNHRCSYCDKANWGGDHPWPTLESCIRFFEQVLLHYADRKITVSFSGGEPTLWPDFEPLLRWLHDRKITIGMTSNGTKGPEFFRKISPMLEWLSFSFHPQFTEPNRFIETVAASSSVQHLAVRLMMPPERRLWNRSYEFGERLRAVPAFSRLVLVEYVPIVEGFGSEHTKPILYEADQTQRFENASFRVGPDSPVPAHASISDIDAGTLSPRRILKFDPNQLITRNQTNFFGWRCEIGQEQLFIDSLGTVSRAGCRVGGAIGHIADIGIQFPTSAVRCDKTFCHCITDIMVTKASPLWDLTAAMQKQADRGAFFRVARSYSAFIFAHVHARLSRGLSEAHRLTKATLPPRLYYTIRDGLRLLLRPFKRLRSRASS